MNWYWTSHCHELLKVLLHYIIYVFKNSGINGTTYRLFNFTRHFYIYLFISECKKFQTKRSENLCIEQLSKKQLLANVLEENFATKNRNIKFVCIYLANRLGLSSFKLLETFRFEIQLYSVYAFIYLKKIRTD
jgi:hypothetical protein